MRLKNLFWSAALFLPAQLLAAAPETPTGGKDVLGQGKLQTVGKSIYPSEPLPLETIVAGLIQTFLGLIGIVFLGLTIYGGYLWLMARGNEQQVEKAKETIKAGVIGLAIILGAYAITTFITTYVIKAVSGTV
ncbi:hypothetical protein EPN90_02455 [Patescibacteria group bacterium]|nr:MAG: hypothetical protein EPN90_02455 [Patescibacteria group bacterium]